jgi:hypothetical protein
METLASASATAISVLFIFGLLDFDNASCDAPRLPRALDDDEA